MRIILFRGRPGVGKTTLSSVISKRHHFPVLRKDDIYHVSAKQVDTHENRNDISYETIYKILEANVETDCTFILDCPFQYPGDLELIRTWCDTFKVQLRSILVTCSDEIMWAERIAQRDERPYNIHHFTDFERLKEFYGTMHLTPEPDELLVDTVHPIEASIKKIEDFI
jgi:adenylate kinase family enzyme